tara:strand:- start:616 stop:1362 length:747 start_codon:yes stop_codon:yes gene_type:complete
MRIAISGTACQGKSTLVKDFLDQWPRYTTPEKTYRDIIAESNLEHSSKTNKETQRKILDFQIEEQQKYRKGSHVIFDRCPLDNLVYSMWACEKPDNDIDESFVESCIPLVRESLRDLDIIFFVPITKVAPIEVVEDGTRDTEKHIIEEIDYIFKAVHRDHEHNPKTNLFVVDDKPPIIEVFGNRRERVEIVKLYIDAEGDAMSPGNLIDEDTLESIESLNEVWEGVDPEEHSLIKKEIDKQRKSRLNT